MNCPKCGAPLKPNARFCTSCGNKLQAPPPGRPAAAGAGAPPVAPPGLDTQKNTAMEFLSYDDAPQPDGAPTPEAAAGFLDPEAAVDSGPVDWETGEPIADNGWTPPGRGPGMAPPPQPDVFKHTVVGGEVPNRFAFFAGIGYLVAVGLFLFGALLTMGPFFIFAIGFLIIPLGIIAVGGLVCMTVARGDAEPRRGFILFCTGLGVPMLLVMSSGLFRGALYALQMGLPMIPFQTLAALLMASLGIVTIIASAYVLRSGVNFDNHPHTRGALMIGSVLFLVGLFIPLAPGGGLNASMALTPFQTLGAAGAMGWQASLGAVISIVVMLLLILAGIFGVISWGDQGSAGLSFLAGFAALHIPAVVGVLSMFVSVFAAPKMPGMGPLIIMTLMMGLTMLLFFYSTLYAMIGGLSDILGPALES